MKVEQITWSNNDGWSNEETTLNDANLVLVFGDKQCIKHRHVLDKIKKSYPNAIRCGCSTAGEICDSEVFDNTVVVTAMKFEKTKVKLSSFSIESPEESFNAGDKIKKELISDDLSHIFILSDGLNVSGSELIKGISKDLPKNVGITGGLAAEGKEFTETLIYIDDDLHSKRAVALGFYGNDIKIGYGSLGGWDSYGIIRKVTKSMGNTLFELDGDPALDLYKKYIGDQANELILEGSVVYPSQYKDISGDINKNISTHVMLFPMSLMEKPDDKKAIVRTVMSVDEPTKSLYFAGDIPEGHYLQLMRGNFNKLVDSAGLAAEEAMGDTKDIDVAVLVSCVARKMILGQRTEEEVEEVRDILGDDTVITGFYSYGEIAPFSKDDDTCKVHNQTMTITTFKEL